MVDPCRQPPKWLDFLFQFRWMVAEEDRETLLDARHELLQDFGKWCEQSPRYWLCTLRWTIENLRHLAPLLGQRILRLLGLVEVTESGVLKRVNALPPWWQDGVPCLVAAQGLAPYLVLVEDLRDSCKAVAIVATKLYLGGDTRSAFHLSEDYWSDARKLAATTGDSVPMWQLSYPYINSMIFGGEFEGAMRLMRSLWENYYATLSPEQKAALYAELKGKTGVNPLCSPPRHMLLAASLQGRLDLEFFQHWFREAMLVCRDDEISHHFSRAYASLYLTLLARSTPTPDVALQERALGVLSDIPATARPVSRYAYNGVRGIIEFARGELDAAAKFLDRANGLAHRTQNAFLSPLFEACRAVALASLGRWRNAKVCLRRSRMAAVKSGSDYQLALVEQACASAALLQGRLEQAKRHSCEASRLGLGEHLVSLLGPR